MPNVFDKGRGEGGPRVNSMSARTPGFSLSSTNQGGNISSSLTRLGSAPQNEFQARFPRILSDIDTLRESIRPGFSDVRQARLNAVSDARSRGLGNLRENLARRRVQGSSFGSAAMASAEREFAREEANQQAQSFLEEFEANRQVLGQEFQAINSQLQRELAELQIASGHGQNLAKMVESARQFDEQIAFQRAQATANTIGSIAGMAVGATGFGGPFGQGGSFGRDLAIPRVTAAAAGS